MTHRLIVTSVEHKETACFYGTLQALQSISEEFNKVGTYEYLFSEEQAEQAEQREEPALNTLYAEYELPALYELAHYTLRIIGEHTARYESEFLDYYLTEEQAKGTRILAATQGDIEAMLGQYKRIMYAIYSRSYRS